MIKSIEKKSFVIVTAAVMIISVYFTAGVLIFSNNQYNEINIENLEEAARTIENFTPASVFSDPLAAADWASHIDNTKTTYHRITLINRNGQVIFDTNADTAVMENHLDRIEFQNAIRHGIGSAKRESATLGQHYLYAAVAIYESTGRLAGVLRISRLESGFYSRLISSTFLFFIGGLLVIFGACAGLYYFSRRLSLSIEVNLDAELRKKTIELKLKADEAEAASLHREVILNSMFDGLLTLDSNLNIIHANPQLRFLFGIDKEKDVNGMSLLSFSRQAELEEAAQLALSTGRSCELTLKRYVSGTEQNFQVFVAPLETGSSSLGTSSPGTSSRGVIIVLGDISRLVKLERVRKDFAANVSHELRTPIQVIQGFAENILHSSMDDIEKIKHFAEIIKKNAEAMENITYDLLTLVSLEDKNTVRSPMEKTALLPLIEDAVGMVTLAAQMKKISINISCSPDLFVPLYSSLFVQALVNLLDNSIKYSKEDSKVFVNVQLLEKNLIIEVRDKGIGISPEHIDRIFERFYRSDRARSRKEGGTGLGLSIVRHIALLHNGTVEAQSHAGDGSVFTLRLPQE
jgi:two-component system phosphate regulon sensor histidine kinase PhoR